MIKRIKSKFGKDVFFAPWDCPLSGVDPLFFIGLLEVHDIRFFLGAKDAIYVVTIPRRSVFRLIDETHLGTLMDVLTSHLGKTRSGIVKRGKYGVHLF